MNLVQIKIKYLEQEIKTWYIRSNQRVLEFSNKFYDVLNDKTQLQRFLDSLNCVSNFYKGLAIDYKLLW